MRSDLTFEALQHANLERCEASYHPLRDWSASDWLMCVTGEIGELACELKRRRRGNVVDDLAIAREMADVVIYLDLLSTSLGISLGEAVVEKFNLVSAKVGSPVRL